jgi:hypothetical protein
MAIKGHKLETVQTDVKPWNGRVLILLLISGRSVWRVDEAVVRISRLQKSEENAHAQRLIRDLLLRSQGAP